MAKFSGKNAFQRMKQGARTTAVQMRKGARTAGLVWKGFREPKKKELEKIVVNAITTSIMNFKGEKERIQYVIGELHKYAVDCAVRSVGIDKSSQEGMRLRNLVLEQCERIIKNEIGKEIENISEEDLLFINAQVTAQEEVISVLGKVRGEIFFARRNRLIRRIFKELKKHE
ncbi:MAG: hypothetical protein V1494_04525 [Candidatus Diapherotrites archaeon]